MPTPPIATTAATSPAPTVNAPAATNAPPPATTVATPAPAPILREADIDPETGECLLTLPEETSSEVSFLRYVRSKFTKENIPKAFQIIQSISSAFAAEIEADLGQNSIAATTAVAGSYAITAVQDVLEISDAVSEDQALQEELIMMLAHLPPNTIQEYHSKADGSDAVSGATLNDSALTFRENFDRRVEFCKKMFAALKAEGRIEIKLSHAIKLELDYTSRLSKRYLVNQFVAVVSNVAGGGMAVELYRQTMHKEKTPDAQMAAMHALQILASFRLPDWYNYFIAQFEAKKVIMHGYAAKILLALYGKNYYAIPEALVQFRGNFMTVPAYNRYVGIINRHKQAFNAIKNNEQYKLLALKVEGLEAKINATRTDLTTDVQAVATEGKQTAASLTVKVEALDAKIDATKTDLTTNVQAVATECKQTIVVLADKVDKGLEKEVREITRDEFNSLYRGKSPLVFSTASSVTSDEEETQSLISKPAKNKPPF